MRAFSFLPQAESSQQGGHRPRALVSRNSIHLLHFPVRDFSDSPFVSNSIALPCQTSHPLIKRNPSLSYRTPSREMRKKRKKDINWLLRKS